MYSTEFENIKEECTLCKKCAFHEERLNIVFGEGSEGADILFVGDFPRDEDDLKGSPLSGRSGSLFGKFVSLCDLDKAELFITNILKCRPADGVTPDGDHYTACMEHLRSQVRLIKPKIIVCLGEEAAKRMIDPAFSMDRDHGRFIKKGKLFFIATCHPAEAVKSEDKRLVFLSDFQALREGARKGGII
ncbi:MAG: uracil-DNA glycosylase [Clostridia bacterium]|nr:uracil-DNA glycosylase [Clostridia bacterium]